MTAPVRIQLRRTKGWRMPINTVKVDRSSRWGNPFKAESFWAAGYIGSLEVANRNCVAAFKAWMLGERHWAHGSSGHGAPPDLSLLRGKNLACWCAPGMPCHADVLLDLANRPIVCEEIAA